MSDHRHIDREIRRLALPSLGSLLAEPLLVAVDSVMVGHLGTVPLAGLSLASTVLTTLVGLCIFLAYATTGATARLFGAGKPKEAYRQGIDGMWLAVGLGVLLMVILSIWARPILGIFGPEADVLEEAARYLRSSAFGLPGMLLVLAATGTLRGVGDTKTPLYAATVGALANIPLNYVLIYPAGLGIFGAGLGTALAQTGMGIWLASIVIRSWGGRPAQPCYLRAQACSAHCGMPVPSSSGRYAYAQPSCFRLPRPPGWERRHSPLIRSQ